MSASTSTPTVVWDSAWKVGAASDLLKHLPQVEHRLLEIIAGNDQATAAVRDMISSGQSVIDDRALVGPGSHNAESRNHTCSIILRFRDDELRSIGLHGPFLGQICPVEAKAPVKSVKKATGSRCTVHAFTQVRDCRFCGPCDVEVEGPIESAPENLSADLALAADDKAESLGWKSGACPHCAWEHRAYLHDEARADSPALEDVA